jgi:hypothetical protein
MYSFVCLGERGTNLEQPKWLPWLTYMLHLFSVTFCQEYKTLSQVIVKKYFVFPFSFS